MNPGLLGLVAALCWGTGDFAARYMTRALGPAQTLLFISGVSMLALSPMALNGDVHRLWEPSALGLTIIAGLSTTITGLLLYKALAQGPLGVVVPITSSYPLPFVAVVMAMGGLTLSLPLGLAMAAVIGGVWVVARAGNHGTYDEEHARGSLMRSMALAGSAAGMFALTILITEAAVSRAGEVEVIWLSRIVEFVILALFLISRRQFTSVSKRMLGLLITMGLVDTVGFVALFTAQGMGDTAIASVASASYGLVTVGLGRMVLKEPVRPVQWLGFAIVIIGAATLTLQSH